MNVRPRWLRGAATMAVLGVVALVALVSPVGATLNKRSVKGVVKKLTYTKSQADARFINVGEAATDAQAVDGQDSSAFVRNADSYTRRWTCSGVAFLPAFGTFDWRTNSSLRRLQSAGGIVFQCGVHLPDGATVTAVEFSVQDTDAVPGNDVSDLEMWRINMASSIGTETLMADAGSTSAAPGNVVLADTTIDAAVIDNDSFSYYVQGILTEPQVGLWGATITYTVTAAQGGG